MCPIYESDDFEADDIIGTIAERMRLQGHSAVIVTGDKDMSQLVCDEIHVYDLANDLWLDEEGVREKFGVSPSQIPDMLALHGDAVDNIPGIPGVGPKTAQIILRVCTGVEDIVSLTEQAGLCTHARPRSHCGSYSRQYGFDSNEPETCHDLLRGSH